MKVLMYGWEFPPKNQGGLGVACEGIVNGLLEHDVEVNLVLPGVEEAKVIPGFKIIGKAPGFLKKISIVTALIPYQTRKSYLEENLGGRMSRGGGGGIYGNTLFQEVARYAAEAGEIALKTEHDVIHAHDWMTYPAAIEAKRVSHKPMVAHVHALEHDRSGDNLDPLIEQIEKIGLEAADKVVAVSEFTKSKIVKHYRIDPKKIVVVHNAVTNKFKNIHSGNLYKNRKTVLFLGRMTMQKGPEYFLKAAQKVLSVRPNVGFLMAGDGDMMGRMIQYAHELGIERNVLFAGFLKGADVDRAFQSADLFVMPSVAEPFGIAALEAIQNGVPVIISKQAGVSEVIPNMLRVDFWDIDEMANKIVMALDHDVLSNELRILSSHDLKKLSWKKQAEKIKNLYFSLT